MLKIVKWTLLLGAMVFLAGNASADPDVTVANGAAASTAGCDGQAFVVATPSLGALRSDFGGFAGMWFTVGAEPLDVTCLGRMFSPGNTRTHTVKLVRALDGTDVPGGSVRVNMAGGIVNQFVYAPLLSPVTLNAHTDYYLVSEEVVGGDQFRDYRTTILTSSLAGVIKDSVYKLPNTGWGNSTLTNRSYGPVNFLYDDGAPPGPSGPFQVTTSSSPPAGGTTTGDGTYASRGTVTVTATPNPGFSFVDWTVDGAEVSRSQSFDFSAVANRYLVANFEPTVTPECSENVFITGTYSLGSLRSDFEGLAGLWFRVGSEPLRVTCLARQFSEGNRRTHTVKVVRASDLSDVPGASADINMSGGTINTFIYKALPAAVTLEAHTEYYLVSSEELNGDQWHDYRTTTVFVNPDAEFVGAVYKHGSEWKPFTAANHAYVLVNFGYETTPGTPVPTVGITASDSEASEPGADTGTFTVSRTGSAEGPLTVFLSVGGTAIGGTDYQALPAQVTIPDGLATTTLQVRPIDDDHFETTESVVATLTQNAAYRIGAQSSATVTIQSDDAPPPVQLFSITTQSSAAEGGQATGSGTYAGNSSVTVSAVASAGYTFLNWTVNGVEVSVLPNFTFTVTSNRTLVAHFDLIPPPPPAPECSPTAFVTSATSLGTLRSDFTGLVGMWIRVGPEPLHVSCLARQFSVGNTGTHTVKLVRASDLTDVPGGAVEIDMAGGTVDGFVYGQLPAPITLNANTDYYLVSNELLGGDLWRDYRSTAVLSTTDATAVGAVYRGDNGWTPLTSLNHSYVLVNFRYQKTPVVPLPTVEIIASDPDASEPGTDTGTFTVSRTGSTEGSLTVHLTVSGRAIGGTDYESVPAEVTLADGMSTATIVVTPLEDSQFEFPEEVTVTLAPNAAYIIGALSSATLTILSDDPRPPGPDFTITTTPSPADGGQTAGDGIYPTNWSVTVSAAANPGFDFINWTVNEVEVSVLPDFTFNVAGDGELVANFVPTPEPDCSATTFVTAPTYLGALRADFSGNVGMWITVGPDPLHVSCLGRQFAIGNSGTHKVKLVRASDRTDVPGGSVDIDMTGGTLNEFVYRPLAQPVVLDANTDYYLVSREETGTDMWRDHIATTVATAPGATCRGAVYMNAFLPWTQVPSPNHSFGLVDFRFQSGAVPTRPTVTIQATDPNASEPGDNTGSFRVSRTGPTTGPLTVFLNISGTATNGTDYQSIPGSVTIPDTASGATIVVTPVDDADFEPIENIELALAPNAAYDLGNPRSATVTIESDDPPPGPLPDEFNITTIADPVSGGTTFGGGAYPPGTLVTVSAISSPGFSFVNWTESGVGVSQLKDFTFNANTDRDLVAHFEATQDPTCNGRMFVTGMTTLGDLRRNFTGWVGMWFTVGPDPIEVTCLGRQLVPGNSGTHTVKLVRALDGTDVPGGAVDVSMVGGNLNEIVYEPLARSVTLEANTAYYLVTEEIAGTDDWRDYTGTLLTTRREAICNGAVYGIAPPAWTTISATDKPFGIVDFQFAPVGDGGIRAASDQTDGRVKFRVLIDGETISILVSGPTGRSYTIETSYDLFHWQPLGPVTLDANGTAKLNHAGSRQSSRFYRAVGF